jgi:hypothetical protein
MVAQDGWCVTLLGKFVFVVVTLLAFVDGEEAVVGLLCLLR